MEILLAGGSARPPRRLQLRDTPIPSTIIISAEERPRFRKTLPKGYTVPYRQQRTNHSTKFPLPLESSRMWYRSYNSQEPYPVYCSFNNERRNKWTSDYDSLEAPIRNCSHRVPLQHAVCTPKNGINTVLHGKERQSTRYNTCTVRKATKCKT